MINVVCVQVGDYCGRGKEYVERLFSGVRSNLSSFRPLLITDNEATAPDWVQTANADIGVNGWWNKISMFRPGVFPKGDRVLYFDLDTIITGDLTDIASYDGKFAALADYYFKGNLNSGVMAWEAGTLDHIWRVWDRCGRPQFAAGGDQDWIEDMQPTYDPWQKMYPGQIVSYKLDCKEGVPDNARVCCFHGKPRPHETDMWK